MVKSTVEFPKKLLDLKRVVNSELTKPQGAIRHRRDDPYQVIESGAALYVDGLVEEPMGFNVEVTRPLSLYNKLYLLVHGISYFKETQGRDKESLYLGRLGLDQTSPEALKRLAERSLVYWISASQRLYPASELPRNSLVQVVKRLDLDRNPGLSR